MESPFRASELIGNDPEFCLIETFGFVPGTGVNRLDLHLDRMARSAHLFQIPFDASDARTQVQAIASETPLRCRMTLSAAGVLAISTAPMPASAAHWHFAFANERLLSGDLFLNHKTTRRALYDSARSHLPSAVDELIFLNEKGEVCEGTITNIMIETQDGAWLTPPQSSGCLPGVFRQSLLNFGLLAEAVLTPADLMAARNISLTNALRGRIPAVWSKQCKVFQEQR